MRFGFIKRYWLAQLGEHGRALGFGILLHRRAVLHVQLRVQLNEPGGFFCKLGLLREGLFEFLACIFNLMLQVLEPPAGFFKLPVQARERVLNALDIAAGICAQLNDVAQLSL